MTASHQLLLGLVAWRVFTHSYPLNAPPPTPLTWLCQCEDEKKNDSAAVTPCRIQLLKCWEKPGWCLWFFFSPFIWGCLFFWKLGGRKGGMNDKEGWEWVGVHMTCVFMLFVVQQTVSSENRFSEHLSPLYSSLRSCWAPWCTGGAFHHRARHLLRWFVSTSSLHSLSDSTLYPVIISFMKGEGNRSFSGSALLFAFAVLLLFFAFLFFFRQIVLTAPTTTGSLFFVRWEGVGSDTCHCDDNSQLG